MEKGQKNLLVTFSLFLGWLLAFIYKGTSLGVVIDFTQYAYTTLLIVYMIIPCVIFILLANFMPDESYRKYFFQIPLMINFVGSAILLIFGNRLYSELNFIILLITLLCIGLASLTIIVGSASYFTYDIPFQDMMRSMGIIIIVANSVVYINDLLLKHALFLFSNIFLLICLIVSFIFAKRLEFSGKTEKTMFHTKLPKKSILLLCFLIFLFNIGGGVVFDTIKPLINETSSHAVYWNIFPYVITAAIMIIAIKEYHSKEIFLSFAAGLIISGFILLALVADFVLIPNILILAGYAILDIFIWSLIGQLGYVYREPFKICSLAMATNVISVVLGSIGSKILIESTDSALMIATFISAFCSIIGITILPLINRITLNDLDDALKYIESKEYDHAQNLRCQRFNLLTDRELEVASHLIKGTKNKEIAKLLFISESTLKTHARNIYTKLEIKNKRELKEMSITLNPTFDKNTSTDYKII